MAPSWQVALNQPNAFTLNDLSTGGRFDLGPTRWVTDDSVISLGATELVSYDLATGEKRWTVGVPGGEICAASFDLTSDGTGAVLSGDRCTKVTAVDTRTGKQLWSAGSGLDNPSNGNPHPAGTNGISVTDEAVTITSQCSGAAVLDIGSGKVRHKVAAADCTGTASYRNVLVSGTSSEDAYEIFDARTGKQTASFSGAPSPAAPWRVVSADPLVVAGTGGNVFGLWALSGGKVTQVGETVNSLPPETIRFAQVVGQRLYVMLNESTLLKVYDLSDGREVASTKLAEGESVAGVTDGTAITVGPATEDAPTDAVVHAWNPDEPESVATLATIPDGATEPDGLSTLDGTLTLHDNWLLIGNKELRAYKLPG
ncbi:MAG: PQQ-binding-like beta-propeller repeat protein [Pseudonocardiaceae bacterium]